LAKSEALAEVDVGPAKAGSALISRRSQPASEAASVFGWHDDCPFDTLSPLVMLSSNDVSSRQSSCLTLIEQNYGQLQGSVRDVADALLRSPGDWVGKSISQLARASGVSEATVVRFVRALGYSGYRSFAVALASSVPATLPSDEKREKPAPDTLMGVVRKVFEEESHALAQAPKTLKNDSLEKAVNALVDARHVFCFAAGNSSLLAGVAEYRLVRLGINCIAIRDAIQMAIQTSLLTPKDVVLAFSQTGRNRDAVDALTLAKQAGATTIGVTSEPGSPLVKTSDIALVLFELHSDSQGSLLDTKVAEIILIDALAACIALRLKNSSKETSRVDRQIERILTRPASRRTRPS
jgi:DNA-binding MurR/RpiR family transcriptional regulator